MGSQIDVNNLLQRPLPGLQFKVEIGFYTFLEG